MKLLPKKPDRLLLFAAFAIWLLRWPLLQVFAWSRMLIDYSSNFGLREGFRMTFSGDHPCPMCLAIREGADAESTWFTVVLESPLPFVFLSVGLLIISFRVKNSQNRNHHVRY